MKRLGSSDSLGALMSICPTSTDEHNQGNMNNNHVYTREFQSMLLDGLDEEICVEESSHMPEKKRRLGAEQVKALEKNFEVENKLEPDRKVKLAQELGLQPRQVAVWFQNRRARWKTKQLERDYGVLKSSFDALKQNYDTLKQDNEAILKEIRQLKAKLQDENKLEVKEEELGTEEEEEEANALMNSSPKCDEDVTELNFKSLNSKNGDMGATLFRDPKDGSSDSDSSAILNEENNNNSSNSAISSSGVVLQSCQKSPHNFFNTNGSSSSSKAILEDVQKAYQTQFVKIEDLNFFSGEEESCSTFFSDDQPPTLHWYNPEEWN